MALRVKSTHQFGRTLDIREQPGDYLAPALNNRLLDFRGESDTLAPPYHLLVRPGRRMLREMRAYLLEVLRELGLSDRPERIRQSSQPA
jgi:hypothetical protein